MQHKSPELKGLESPACSQAPNKPVNIKEHQSLVIPVQKPLKKCAAYTTNHSLQPL